MSRKEALGEPGVAARARSRQRPSSSLSEAELEDLTEAIREARHRQAAELHAAAERAFAHIPWLLRGPIRRVMGG